MRLGETIPALPVGDPAAAAAFHQERLGFDIAHLSDDLAVVRRDDATLHLWQADDQTWTTRPTIERPVRSGAESFLAGTASCRIRVDDLDALWAELRNTDVLHGTSTTGPKDTDYGAREFHVLDLDGNLIGFFRWT
jgi:hypothetical protein